MRLRVGADGRYFLPVNPSRPRSTRPVIVACAALIAFAGTIRPAGAQTSVPPPSVAVPGSDGPADACPAGRISHIDIENGPVGPSGPSQAGLVGWGFRLANHLHVRTTRGFIRGELLFAEGDCFDPALAIDSQRLLDRYSFIAAASVVAQDDSAGGKVVRVETRDQWSTKGDVGVTYDEGLNLETFRFTEQNFLGRGLFVEFAHHQRLEQRSGSLSLSVPRLFQRTSAGFGVSSSPDGKAVYGGVGHPFVGDAGRLSARESFSESNGLFAYATDGGESYSHVLVPLHLQQIQIAAATRRGPPGASVILGGSLIRESWTPKTIDVAFNGNYDQRVPPPEPLPASVSRQVDALEATRVAVHVGLRHYRYLTLEGLDAVRDQQIASLGFFAGATLGKGLPLPASKGVTALHDITARAHASWGVLAGPLLFHGGLTGEGRHEHGEWKDVLAEAEFVIYAMGLPGQTFFFRASGAGGWATELPYQLTLGGREGVRSLGNDRFPGGRQTLFVLEDRIRFPRMPQNALDLGATLFADLGRVWPGDVPFGTDSGWQAAAGFGLRIGFPAGSRNIWRPDIVFPVGPGAHGSPVFRVTFELNRLRAGFVTPDAVRSHRLGIGPDSF